MLLALLVSSLGLPSYLGTRTSSSSPFDLNIGTVVSASPTFPTNTKHEGPCLSVETLKAQFVPGTEYE